MKDQGVSRRSFPEATSPRRRFAYFADAGKVGRRPQTAKSLFCRSGGFVAAAASFFLNDQKETKESPGVAHGHLRCPTPPSPDPLFYGGSPLKRRQSRPARCPHERCLNLLAAAHLNGLDHLHLQDDLRLSIRTYAVGGGRRAHTVRPYEQRKPLHGSAGGQRPPLRKDAPFSMCGSPGGIPNQEAAEGRPQTMTQRSGHGLERRSKGMERRIPARVFGAEWTLRRRGPRSPFWSFQGEGVARGRGKFEIPLPLDGSLVTFCPHRKSLARR